MKTRRVISVFAVLLLIAMFAAAALANPDGQVRKIVVFDAAVVNGAAQDAIVARHGGVVIKDLNLISGKAVMLPPPAVQALAGEAGVVRIDDDVLVYASSRPGGGTPPPPQPPEVLPWGVDRVDADSVWQSYTGSGVKVGVIDTGIDLTHPDLAANIKGNFNAISSRKNGNDDNGHGTHVAGTIAAIDNEIGVIGMAPQVQLYAIKVLSKSGSGFLSDVIEGLDWAVAHGMDVVNMSLGSSSDVQSLHDAVKRVHDAGIVVVAAAGNESGPVSYPGAYPEAIGVAATDSSNTVAYFSNYGPEVDVAAPGVSVYSTYYGGGYATLSGTSMATPHVTGLAALLVGAGWTDPEAIRTRLMDTALDLGPSGFDPYYGAGLVQAPAALGL